jgi:hypothetical protein
VSIIGFVEIWPITGMQTRKDEEEESTCPKGFEDSENSPFHGVNLWEM